MSIRASFLSYDQIATIADKTLSDAHPSRSIPVPVEDVVEIHFGIQVQVQAALRDLAEVEALLNSDCTTMYVDAHAYLAPGLQRRLRFSYAHELGHYVMHREVISQLRFTTIPEWKTRYSTIPGDELGWIEFQANAFAGLILVPRRELRIEWHKEWERVLGKNPDASDDYLRPLVVDAISKRFDVSGEVAKIRCEKDGLTRLP